MASAAPALPVPTTSSSSGRTPGLASALPSKDIGVSIRAAAVARAWSSILGDDAEEEAEKASEEQDQQQQQGTFGSKGKGHASKGPRRDEGTSERPRPQALRGLEEAEALSANFSPGRAAQIWEKLHTWRAVEFGTLGSLFHRCCLLDWQGRVVSPWHIPLYACDAALHFVCTTPQDSWLQLEAAPEEELNPLRVVRRPKTSTTAPSTSGRVVASAAATTDASAGQQPDRAPTRTWQPDSHYGIIPASLPELGTRDKGSYTEGFSFNSAGTSLGHGHVRAQSLTTHSSSALGSRSAAGLDASSAGSRGMEEGGGWDEEPEERLVRQRKARTREELRTMEPGHYAENSIFNVGFLPQTWADGSSFLFPMGHTGSSSTGSSHESTPRGTKTSHGGSAGLIGRNSMHSQDIAGKGRTSGNRANASIPSGLASASVASALAAASSPGSALESGSQPSGTRASGRPVEAIEIGTRPARRGEVYSTKPLAAFAVEDEAGGVAWKVVVIASDDALAPQLHGLADLERLYPAVLDQVQEWLRFSHFHATSLDEEATILCGGQPQDVVTSLVVVAEAHSAWQLQFHDMEPPSRPWQLEDVAGASLPGPSAPSEPQKGSRDAQGQVSGGLTRLARVLEREWERRGYLLPLARSSPEQNPAQVEPEACPAEDGPPEIRPAQEEAEVPPLQDGTEVCPAEDGQGASCTPQGTTAGDVCEIEVCREPSELGQSPEDRETEASCQGVAEGRWEEGSGSFNKKADAQRGPPCSAQQAPQEVGPRSVGTRLGPPEEAQKTPLVEASPGVSVDDILQCISLTDRRVFSGRSFERERARAGPGAGVGMSSSSSSHGQSTGSSSSGESSSSSSRSSATHSRSRSHGQSTRNSFTPSTSTSASPSTVGAGNSLSAKNRRGRSRSDWGVPGPGAFGEGGRTLREREGQSAGLALTRVRRAVSWTAAAAAAVPSGRGSQREEGSHEQDAKWGTLLPKPLCGLGTLRGLQKRPLHSLRGSFPETFALWEGNEEGEREGATPVPGVSPLCTEAASGAAGPSAPRRISVRGLALLGRRDAGGSRGNGEKGRDAETRRVRSRSWTGVPLGSSPFAGSPAGVARKESVGNESVQSRAGEEARKSRRGAGGRMRWSAGNWQDIAQAPGPFLGSASRDHRPKPSPLRTGLKTASKAGGSGCSREQGFRSKGHRRSVSVASGHTDELPAPHSLEASSLAGQDSPTASPAAEGTVSSLCWARGAGRRGGEGRASPDVSGAPSAANQEKGVPSTRGSLLQVRPSISVSRDAGRRNISPPRSGGKPGRALQEASSASAGLSSHSSSFNSSTGSSKGSSTISSHSSSSSGAGRGRIKAYARSSSLPSDNNRGQAGPSSASAVEQRSMTGGKAGKKGDAAGQGMGMVRRRLVVTNVQLSGCGVADEPLIEAQQRRDQTPGNSDNNHSSSTGTGTGTTAGASASASESRAATPPHLGPCSGESILHLEGSSAGEGLLLTVQGGTVSDGARSGLLVDNPRGSVGPCSPHESCVVSHTTTGLDSILPERASAPPPGVALGSTRPGSARGQGEGGPRASSFARKRQVSFHNSVEVVEFIEECGVPQAPAEC